MFNEHPRTVLVTGGTGFVGAHTARALLDRGHAVRLFVRSRAKVKQVLGPLGLADLPTVEGDMTDPTAAARAVEGCDALVHAAAAVWVHRSQAAAALDQNTRGAMGVIGAALQAGLPRIVQVSSLGALQDPRLSCIDDETPLPDLEPGYGRSKAEADRWVRARQDEGAPIATTYPGGILGPDDPGMSAAVGGMPDLVRHGCILTTSGIQIIDVRDLADLHARLIEGGPPGRYTAGGHFLPWADFVDQMERAVGHPIRRISLGPTALAALGWLGDLLHGLGLSTSHLSRETMRYTQHWRPALDRKALALRGGPWRPVEQTLGDMVAWLRRVGRLPA